MSSSRVIDSTAFGGYFYKKLNFSAMQYFLIKLKTHDPGEAGSMGSVFSRNGSPARGVSK